MTLRVEQDNKYYTVIIVSSMVRNATLIEWYYKMEVMNIRSVWKEYLKSV